MKKFTVYAKKTGNSYVSAASRGSMAGIVYNVGVLDYTIDWINPENIHIYDSGDIYAVGTGTISFESIESLNGDYGGVTSEYKGMQKIPCYVSFDGNFPEYVVKRDETYVYDKLKTITIEKHCETPDPTSLAFWTDSSCEFFNGIVAFKIKNEGDAQFIKDFALNENDLPIYRIIFNDSKNSKGEYIPYTTDEEAIEYAKEISDGDSVRVVKYFQFLDADGTVMEVTQPGEIIWSSD